MAANWVNFGNMSGGTNINASSVITNSGLVLIHPNGKTIKNDAGIVRLNTGSPIVLQLYRGSDVFNSVNGRVALFQDGNSSNGFRHNTLILKINPFQAGNYDWAWQIIYVNNNTIQLYNDYSGGYWLGYDSVNDQLIITNVLTNRVDWTILGQPQNAFVDSGETVVSLSDNGNILAVGSSVNNPISKITDIVLTDNDNAMSLLSGTYFTITGKKVISTGTLSAASVSNVIFQNAYLGINAGTVHGQVAFVRSFNTSEQLIVTLKGPCIKVTCRAFTLVSGEEGGEQGKWTAYLNNVVVGQGIILTPYSDSIVTFTVSANMATNGYVNNTFDSIIFEATEFPFLDGNTPASANSSDYGLKIMSLTPAIDTINAVKVYRYSSNTWSQLGSTISIPEANTAFGSSVCLNGDGTLLAVSSPYSNNNTGKILVYRWNTVTSV